MDYTEKSPVVLSLCPGMLGLERGFERASSRIGWMQHTTAAYVEIEAFIIWNLVSQMEKGVLGPAPIWSNVKTFNWEILRGKIDFIFGGYPCQPFSVAGKKLGTEDPRHLWPYIKKGIQTIKPVGCFFENVPGHINLGFREVKSDLESMGYRVKAGIYSASEVGAPHLRKRLFILAKLANTGHAKPSGRITIKERQQPNGGRESWGESSPQSVREQNELANTLLQRLQRHGNQYGLSEISEQGEVERGGYDAMADTDIRGEQHGNNAGVGRFREQKAWPSRPGQNQYVWESPRTVESDMGTTINGYDFREDLLRMAGNGVVEQTAELAFLDLLRKHGIY